MFITREFDILFLVCMSYLVIKASRLKAKGFLKEHKGVYTRVKGSLGFSTKKKHNNTK